MEVGGAWWAVVSLGADESHSSPMWGEAVGASGRWVHAGFLERPGFLPGHSFATVWVLLPRHGMPE